MGCFSTYVTAKMIVITWVMILIEFMNMRREGRNPIPTRILKQCSFHPTCLNQ